MEDIKVLTPVKAIRAKCMDCSNQQWSEVKRCPVVKCPLYPWRMGKRPKKDSDGKYIVEILEDDEIDGQINIDEIEEEE